MNPHRTNSAEPVKATGTWERMARLIDVFKVMGVAGAGVLFGVMTRWAPNELLVPIAGMAGIGVVVAVIGYALEVPK